MIIPNIRKKQKEHDKNIHSEWQFYVVIFCILIVSFLLLQPKISSMLFPQKREYLLNNFIEHVKDGNKIDARAYWEFREFYSPGHFIFERNGISQSTVDNFLYNVQAIRKEHLHVPFLYFQSPYMQSVDSLTNKQYVDEVVNMTKIQSNKILAKNSRVLIFRETENNLLLIFVLSGEDMKKANGFFDYRKRDKEYVKDKNWVNVSRIEIK
jgi:hypothetical protein